MEEKDEEEDFSALFAKWGLDNEQPPVHVVVKSDLDDEISKAMFINRGLYDDNVIKEGLRPEHVRNVDTIDTLRESWNSLLERDLTFGKPLQSVSIEEMEHEFQELGVPSNHLDNTRKRLSRLIMRTQNIEATRRKTLTETLPSAELFAIGAYSEKYAFTALNKSLWDNEAPKKFPGFTKTLIRALRRLPYVWDAPLYHGGLRTSELDKREKGDLITWKGFMSTSRREDVAKLFISARDADKSCIYHVKSWNGRDICEYSQYRYEKEVLLPPYTLFEITKKEEDENGVLIVEMEELPIWRGSRCTLWVDDQPDNNKVVMERAELTGTNFVMAKSTAEAMAFITYDAHKPLLKKYSKCLRVVTDMARKEENGVSDDEAGCKLIRGLIDNGYTEKVMVYVNNEQKAWDKLDRYGLDESQVFVTRDYNDVYRFCTFDTPAPIVEEPTPMMKKDKDRFHCVLL